MFLHLLLFIAQAAPAQSAPKCIFYTKAKKQIGETVCITGKVLKIGESKRSGTLFMNFCDDYRSCPFTVVVFAKDLEKVGDVKKLEGQTIEIHGKVQEYNGQAEIILNDPEQLRGPVVKAPAPPGKFDAADSGKNSPGSAIPPKATKKTTKKPAKSPSQTPPDGF